MTELRRIPAHAGKTSPRSRPRSPSRAHPRSRGENLRQETPCPAIHGASPLTRGKHLGELLGGFDVGRIPAHAGKTAFVRGGRSRQRAHPRSRGENYTVRRLKTGAQGASPLTRGKQTAIDLREVSLGRIPAHAGKTRTTAPAALMSSAHPRSRGENPTRPAFSASTTGASPLTRGKLEMGLLGGGGLGRIPAHAGKTLPDLRFYRADRSDLGKP